MPNNFSLFIISSCKWIIQIYLSSFNSYAAYKIKILLAPVWTEAEITWEVRLGGISIIS